MLFCIVSVNKFILGTITSISVFDHIEKIVIGLFLLIGNNFSKL
jgi:hypothetical protein